MTGGGYQALWLLADPMAPKEAEDLNKALLRGLEGGPGTHDISRLLRVPCTVNWLNDAKRKAGRSPILGELALPDDFSKPPTKYSATNFSPPENATLAQNSPAMIGPAATPETPVTPAQLPKDPLDALPEDGDWRNAISHGKAPPGKTFASRSELLFASTIWMLSKDVEDDVVLAILLSPGLAIGDHIRDRCPDQGSAKKYAERQLHRAKECLRARTQHWPAMNENGNPIANNPHNIRHALSILGVVVNRNLFTQEDEVEGGKLEDRDLNDIADILTSVFSRKLGFGASVTTVKRELITLAHENRYHPVTEYLDHLEWDGVQRLDQWLIKYCGVEDSELHREFGAKTFIAAVRRIKNPGCKFDTMLVLEGAQGVGKSSLLRVLCVRDSWFCESLNLKSDDRERAQILARAWIVECQELDGLNKVTSENLKKFLSESTDTYRKPYDRNARQYPRHCVIIGTTNESDYLRDITGNRRFWPVRVGKIDLKGIQAVVDQLWAEAVQREANGEEITLSSQLWDAAAEAQQQRLAEDPYADVLAGTLGEAPGKVSMESVKLILDITTAKLTPHDSRRIRAVMEKQGWRYGTYRFWVQARRERRPVRGFFRGNADGTLPEIGVRKAQSGKIEIGLIGEDGKFEAGLAAREKGLEIPF